MTLVLWLMLLIAIVQVGMATHALIIERREGLVPSTRRLAFSGAISLGLVAIVLYASLAPALTHEDVPSAPQSAASRADELRARLNQLHDEEARLTAELAELASEPPDTILEAQPSASSLTLPFVVPTWLVLAALFLVLVGTLALVMLGKPSTLVPVAIRSLWTGQRPPSADALARAARAAVAGRHDEAQEQLTLVRAEQLDELMLLDYLFLDAYVPFAQGALLATPRPAKERAELLERAGNAVDRLLTRAPKMSEGHYLRARISAQRGEPGRALAAIRTAKPGLEAEVDVRNDESVCLLRLAESELASAKVEEAKQHFEEVRKLGVMASAIPVAFLLSRLAEARKQLRAGQLQEARAIAAEVRATRDLDAEQRRAADVACDALEVVALYRDVQHQEAHDAARAFLSRWLPATLPPVDHETAEEYLEPAFDVSKLELPRPLFRGLFVLVGVCQVHAAAKAGAHPDARDLPRFAEPLLRALQIEPRQRDALACLGALYLALDPTKTAKALEWIDSAIVMGVRSESLKRLQSVSRREENERQQLLDAFAVTARRFLVDPSVAPQVRRALIDELGRFAEFQPIVLDLAQISERDAMQPVTIDLLRDRSAHLRARSTELTRRRGEAAKRLATLTGDYGDAVESLTKIADRVTALEGTLVEEMGRLVLR